MNLMLILMEMQQWLSADPDLIELGLAHIYRVVEPKEYNDSLPVAGIIFHLDKQYTRQSKGLRISINYDDRTKSTNNTFHFYHFMVPQCACGLIPRDETLGCEIFPPGLVHQPNGGFISQPKTMKDLPNSITADGHSTIPFKVLTWLDSPNYSLDHDFCLQLRRGTRSF